MVWVVGGVPRYSLPRDKRQENTMRVLDHTDRHAVSFV
jgi:hypothetical protein